MIHARGIYYTFDQLFELQDHLLSWASKNPQTAHSMCFTCASHIALHNKLINQSIKISIDPPVNQQSKLHGHQPTEQPVCHSVNQ